MPDWLDIIVRSILFHTYPFFNYKMVRKKTNFPALLFRIRQRNYHWQYRSRNCNRA